MQAQLLPQVCKTAIIPICTSLFLPNCCVSQVASNKVSHYFWLMYSQRINTSWQGKTTWKYGTGKVQSFEPESNLLVYSLTFRAMPIATEL
jgi:hypothetical protein